MIYLYAYTNHKKDLDSLRRMGALWKMLDAEGIEAELLVNDYRAQLAGRELGLPLATTIETVRDIDAVAGYGDIVVIDSSEELPPALMERYAEFFSCLFRIVPGGADPLAGERVIDPFDRESLLFDPRYVEARDLPKEERRLLIYRDSDPQKELLSLREYFEEEGFELYWGTYFYVKYEEALAEIFPVIHESEDYRELVMRSSVVVTAMPQTALEAWAAGARVLLLTPESREPVGRLAEAFGIPTLEMQKQECSRGWSDRAARSPEPLAPAENFYHQLFRE